MSSIHPSYSQKLTRVTSRDGLASENCYVLFRNVTNWAGDNDSVTKADKASQKLDIKAIKRRLTLKCDCGCDQFMGFTFRSNMTQRLDRDGIETNSDNSIFIKAHSCGFPPSNSPDYKAFENSFWNKEQGQEVKAHQS